MFGFKQERKLDNKLCLCCDDSSWTDNEISLTSIQTHTHTYTYTKALVFDFLSGRCPAASGSIQDQNRKERLREGERNRIACRSQKHSANYMKWERERQWFGSFISEIIVTGIPSWSELCVAMTIVASTCSPAVPFIVESPLLNMLGFIVLHAETCARGLREQRVCVCITDYLYLCLQSYSDVHSLMTACPLSESCAWMFISWFSLLLLPILMVRDLDKPLILSIAVQYIPQCLWHKRYLRPYGFLRRGVLCYYFSKSLTYNFLYNSYTHTHKHTLKKGPEPNLEYLGAALCALLGQETI